MLYFSYMIAVDASISSSQ